MSKMNEYSVNVRGQEVDRILVADASKIVAALRARRHIPVDVSNPYVRHHETFSEIKFYGGQQIDVYWEGEA